MSLDSVVARMVMRAKQIERALHDPGPWTVTVGPHAGQFERPARRVVGEDHVTFYAIADMGGSMTGTDLVAAELNCGGDIVACKLLPSLGGLAEIAWTFEIADSVVTA